MNEKHAIENKVTQTAIHSESIQSRILTIRGLQVLLDRDLASLYGVETKRLNEQTKRNIERFPEEFMFQLSAEEFTNWRSQFATSNSDKMGLRHPPYAFTEQGVAMLSSVLKSETAAQVSIQIINAFVNMRRFLLTNAQVFQRLDTLELKQIETDKKLSQVFDAISSRTLQPKQGIFFDGQVFDAYIFANDLIKTAKKSIVLMDNYIDETVLALFSTRAKNISCTILTKSITKKLELDVKKHNEQYPCIVIKEFDKAHDRFMIIDEKEVYHFGASLKDLGKKWFAFSKIDISALELLGKMKGVI